MFEVRLQRESKALLDFLAGDDFKKRSAALSRIVARKVAKGVLEEIVKSIPEGTADEKAYKKSLALADIADQPAVAITGFVGKELATADAATTLVYVPIRGPGVRDPAGSVLSRYEPWALYTLPPINYVGPLVLRAVSNAEVIKAAAVNTTMRPAADTMLRGIGVRFGSRFEHKGKAFLDVENFALRIEFGLPGVTTRSPHWKQPVLEAQRGVQTKEMAKDASFQDLVQETLLDPRGRRWKAEDRPTEKQLDVGDAKRFEDFQDRLI